MCPVKERLSGLTFVKRKKETLLLVDTAMAELTEETESRDVNS